jgi:hypothetical protein
MKLRISLYLLTLALAASSTMTAYARECSNKTLKGTYANSLHGLVFIPGVSTPIVLAGVVKSTYDAMGTSHKSTRSAITAAASHPVGAPAQAPTR